MADRTKKTRVRGPGLCSRPKGPLGRGNKQVSAGLDSLLRVRAMLYADTARLSPGRRRRGFLGKVLGLQGSLGFQRTRVGCLG